MTGGCNRALLWAGQFVNTTGLMMLVPIMPFYLEAMGTSGMAETQTWAGMAIAAPALALTFTTPRWGRLGDRIGRKWMVVRALLGLAGAMVVMAAAATPLMLVAGRLLQGTFGGVVEASAAFAGSTGSAAKRGSALNKSFSPPRPAHGPGPSPAGVRRRRRLAATDARHRSRCSGARWRLRGGLAGARTPAAASRAA